MLGKCNNFTSKIPFIFLINIFFLLIKTLLLAECPNTAPILISKECKMDYCTEEQFNSSYCEINNEIIKTQWLNNIIQIGGLNYRYINFASFSNGDMVVETTCYPGEPKRYFYGLKSNGRPFFTDKTTKEETPYYVIETNGQNNHKGKYESEPMIIKSSESGSGNGKEYYLSVSKLECYAELFDFDNNAIYYKSLKQFTGKQIVKTFRHAFFPYQGSSNKYYYFFGFTEDKDSPNENNNLTINFQKHYFPSIKNFTSQKSYTGKLQTLLKGYGKIISSFQTDSGLIINFFLKKTDKIYFNIRKYKSDFSDPIDYTFENTIDNEEVFYKCVHLKGEIGVFSFYKKINNDPYLSFMFKEFNIEKNQFDDYLSNSEILLEQKIFNPAILLNDIIKFNENKICFTTVLMDKETLYIILINIFGDKLVKLRFYSVPLYSLYHYKVLFDLRIHNYNNFLAFASSYCPNQNCDSNDYEHYTALIIFSYPNSTDVEFNVEEYLLENNDITFNNVQINFKNSLTFENNVFGYILNYVEILGIFNCGNYIFYMSSDETNEIYQYSNLALNDNITLKYKGNDNIYPVLNCVIQYHYTATEPDLNIYDNYPEIKTGDEDNESYFEKGLYEGRLSNFTIKSNNILTSDCPKNCDLCLYSNNDYCITCKYNYSLNTENGIKTKKCYDTLEDISTNENSLSDDLSYTENEITYINTEEKSENIENESSSTINDDSLSITNKEIDKMSNEKIEDTEETEETESTEKTEETEKTESTEKTEKTESTEKKEETESTEKTEKTESTEKTEETEETESTEKVEETEKTKSTEKVEETEKTKSTEKTEETEETKSTEKTEETEKTESTEKIKNPETEETKIIEKTCSNEEILSNNCQKGKVSENQIEKLNEDVKNQYLTKEKIGQNNIIITENILFQITTLDNQTSSNSVDISIIDLGDCEEKLRSYYTIPEEESLIIYKTDVKTSDLINSYIQYEIYNPVDLVRLNLSICYDSKITISSKLNLDNSTLSLYNSLFEYGYNLFNRSDSFYTDICCTYTTQNGTDITLADRESEIYNNNDITFCQVGCELIEFNSVTQYAKCYCNPQINEIEAILTSSDDKFVLEMFKESIFTTIENSNLLVLKCYKLALDTSTLLNNYGRIFMTLIIVLFLIFFLVLIFKEFKKVDTFIISILNNYTSNQKQIGNSNQINKKGRKKSIKNKKKNKIKRSNTEKGQNTKSKLKLKKKKFEPPRKKNLALEKNGKKNDLSNSENNISSKNFINVHNINDKKLKTLNNNNQNTKPNINIIKIKNIQIKKYMRKKNTSKNKPGNIFNKRSYLKHKESKNNLMKNITNNINNNLNDHELNTLDYEQALLIDKRTYSQYYISLLKKKQIILFTFCSSKDYLII